VARIDAALFRLLLPSHIGLYASVISMQFVIAVTKLESVHCTVGLHFSHVLMAMAMPMLCTLLCVSFVYIFLVTHKVT